MDCRAGIGEDFLDRQRSCSAQLRTPMRKTVEQLSEDLVCSDQVHIAERFPGMDGAAPVLVIWIEGCTPIKRVCKDPLHFLFDVPCR